MITAAFASDIPVPSTTEISSTAVLHNEINVSLAFVGFRHAPHSDGSDATWCIFRFESPREGIISDIIFRDGLEDVRFFLSTTAITLLSLAFAIVVVFAPRFPSTQVYRLLYGTLTRSGRLRTR
jgi:hypothetical protein